MADVGRLHVIVNVSPDRDGRALADEVLRAGAPVLQIRAKGVDDRTRLALTEPLVERCHAHGARAVVNDRADVAVATAADGVHGGAEDLPVEALRRVVGAGRLVGGTARDAETADGCRRAGADYVGVGPVYATSSKRGLPDPLGPGAVERVVAAVDLPVIAISGVTVERVPELLAAGAHGVAVISAIADADDPAAETRRFLAVLEAR